MDSRSEIESNFKVFGVELSKDVLTKCEEICLQYHVSPVDLVEAWMAFACTKSAGTELTLDSLAQLERKEFSKTANKDVINKSSTLRPPKGSPLLVYGSNSKDTITEDIINTYCSTPKRKVNEKRAVEDVTPDERYSGKRQVSAVRSPRVAFSPASYSPIATAPSSGYASRSNAGEKVFEFGQRASLPWKPRGPMPSLEVAMYGKGPNLGADARYMYEKLLQKSFVLSDRIEELTAKLIEVNKLPLDSIDYCSRFVGTAHAFGRVCCDANGRLNPSSVLLEGSHETTYGRSVALKLSQVASYSLFPGQVVAVEGTNPSGTDFIALKIFSNASPDFPEEPIRINTSEGPLHIVAAAGPYTQMDSMTFQPLEDLMEYVRNNEPHVLILIGPFLDSKHQHVKDNVLVDSFDVAVENIFEGISKSVKGLATKVVIVSSARDVHHHTVYPTPPYKVRRTYPDILFAPDPCLLDLSGVIVGVTATDVIKHISKEEICNPPQGGDRLGRLASHLLSQRSFYPLQPSSEDISLDTVMSEQFCSIPVKPHVLILPSDLRYFIKDVNGCIVANPERLAKGMVGGTFVRFEIKPVPEGKSLVKSTVAEVVRI